MSQRPWRAINSILPHSDWAADDLRALAVKTLIDTATVVKETADSNAYGFAADKPDGAVCFPHTETRRLVEDGNGAWHILHGL
jgi:hypothetical protein